MEGPQYPHFPEAGLTACPLQEDGLKSCLEHSNREYSVLHAFIFTPLFLNLLPQFLFLEQQTVQDSKEGLLPRHRTKNQQGGVLPDSA